MHDMSRRVAKICLQDSVIVAQEVNKINPLMLPSIGLKSLGDLPSSSGLYFALSGIHVLYIGLSTNIRFRWCGHKKRKWDGRIIHHKHQALLEIDEKTRLAYWLYDDDYLDYAETIAIQLFRPPLNKSFSYSGTFIF